jgi:hypothetical protein
MDELPSTKEMPTTPWLPTRANSLEAPLFRMNCNETTVLLGKWPPASEYCSGPLKSEVVELSPRVVDVEINDDFTGPDL